MAREFLNNSDIIWVYLASETLINFMILKIFKGRISKNSPDLNPIEIMFGDLNQ